MKFFDTFSGIAGFALPLTELGHECCGFSEIDKYAIQIYRSHFPTHHPYGDITRIDATTLPDFDLLTAGFPCQSFSVAGKRRGFLDTRGTLFFDVCRIAKEKRPRLLLLENVKGLLNHAGGDTFCTILSALDELGYDADWQVCNSRHFGVPQNRERVFIVGHLRGQSRPEVFPLADSGCEDDTPEFQQAEDLFAGTVSTKNQGPQCQFDGGTTLIFQRARGNNPGGVKDQDFAPTLTKGFGDGNLAVMRTIATLGPEKPDGRYRPRERVMDAEGIARAVTTYENQMPFYAIDYKHPNSTTRRGRIKEGYTGALDTDVQQGILNGSQIRRLTPVECEKLQAFPPGWTEFGTDEKGQNIPISDTQRYKVLGNSVTTNVVREIVKRLS